MVLGFLGVCGAVRRLRGRGLAAASPRGRGAGVDRGRRRRGGGPRPAAPGLLGGLPACGSLVLLAATNHVCQDVAPMPFLWVSPLALYLLTFIICFDHERWYLRAVFAALSVLSIGAVCLCSISGRPSSRSRSGWRAGSHWISGRCSS